MNRMEFCPRTTSILLIVTLLASSVLAPFQSAVAGTPVDDLKQIEYKYYFRGKYPQAIESLQTYLARVDLTETDALRAREVLAASYVLGGAPVMGKQVFAELIAKNPSYPGPDPAVFKSEVVNEYALARSEYASLTLQNAPPSAGKDSAQQPGDQDRATAVANDAVASQGGKPIYKQWWFYAGTAALLLVGGMAVGGGDDGGSPPPSAGGVTVGVTVH
jgi:hypothetical protein